MPDPVPVEPAPSNANITPGTVRPISPTSTVAPSSSTTTEPDDPSVLYVSPAGDDTADGQTELTAVQTVQRGLDILQAGQTLLIMEGTYSRTGAFILKDINGDAERWTTVTAYPGHQPVLEVTQGDGFRVERSSYIIVSDLEVRGVGFTPEWSAIPGNDSGHGILGTSAHHLIVERNEVYNFPVNGFGSEKIDQTVIRDNVIHENAFYEEHQGSGISVWRPQSAGFGDDENGYSIYIIGNVVYGNMNLVAATPFGYTNKVTDGNGVIIDQTRINGYEGRILVANNVIFDNGGRAVNIFESDRVDVVHNTTYHNVQSTAPELAGGKAELWAYRASDVRFANNLVVPSDGIRASDSGESNGVQSVGGNTFLGDARLRSDTDNSIEGADPFVLATSDSASADFSLVAGSGPIDMALPGWAPVLDVDFHGNVRPSGTAPDAGAIEYVIP